MSRQRSPRLSIKQRTAAAGDWSARNIIKYIYRQHQHPLLIADCYNYANVAYHRYYFTHNIRTKLGFTEATIHTDCTA